ncbi:Uncharacterised protein [Mycobacteroides abscessus subsp. abscessus]|nr:Uncharacterised protein [Mycobacteroides abscessus subsp. abscessus]
MRFAVGDQPGGTTSRTTFTDQSGPSRCGEDTPMSRIRSLTRVSQRTIGAAWACGARSAGTAMPASAVSTTTRTLLRPDIEMFLPIRPVLER